MKIAILARTELRFSGLSLIVIGAACVLGSTVLDYCDLVLCSVRSSIYHINIT